VNSDAQQVDHKAARLSNIYSRASSRGAENAGQDIAGQHNDWQKSRTGQWRNTVRLMSSRLHQLVL